MDTLIYLWLEAEEENRNDNINEALRLKNKFSKRYAKLNKEQQEYVSDYLEGIGN